MTELSIVFMALRRIAATVSLVLIASTPTLAAPWLVITEVGFVDGADSEIDFVEIYHASSPRVDLAEFRLEGDVEFTFPRASVLRPRSALVVARDPGSMRARSGDAVVTGGAAYRTAAERAVRKRRRRIRLVRPGGAIVAEARFDVTADRPRGGRSLSLRDPVLDPQDPANWLWTAAPDATPGRVPRPPSRLQKRTLVARGATWRFWRGARPVGANWNQSGFDDASWETGPGGFGYGDGDDRTLLDDMRGQYTTVFTRTEFGLEDPNAAAALALEVDYDDGFIAYVNGREVARSESMGSRHSTPGRVESARRSREAGRVEVFRIASADCALGRNVLAVEGHNESIDSSDFSLDVSLSVVEAATNRPVESGPLERPRPSPRPSAPRVPLALNEISYHPFPGSERLEFIEIVNHGDSASTLAGLRLTGGIEFAFPKEASIAPDGFLVVAGDPVTLAGQTSLPESSIVGPWRGSLSNRGERVALVDAQGAVLDEVRYADARPWPASPDGDGTTLERVHPRLDGSIAASWRASRPAETGAWQTVRYTKQLRAPRVGRHVAWEFLLLGAGECFVDDVRIEDDSGRIVLRESFDDARTRFVGYGNHDASRIEETDAGGALAVRASGRGNPHHNYVLAPLDAPLETGRRYTVSFRARWRHGSPNLLTRTSAHGLPESHRLEVPAIAGTPGRANSRRDESPSPSVGVPEQWPVAPLSSERVEVSVSISAVDPIESVSLRYRAQGQPLWSRARMERTQPTPPSGRDSTTWRGTIPALDDSSAEYFIEAVDANGRVGRYPRTAPNRTALYPIDVFPDERFPSYTLVFSARDRALVESGERCSNRTFSASFVYGDSRIIHDVQVRGRGSPWHRGRDGQNWRVEFGADTLDGRRTLVLDGQNLRGQGWSRGARTYKERLSLWLVDELGAPSSRQRYVRVLAIGDESNANIYEDVERVDRRFVDRWFNGETDDARPVLDRLHKVNGHWELLPSEFPPALRAGIGRERTTYLAATLEFPHDDLEEYRWNYPLRANDHIEDYAALGELLRITDPSRTPDTEFGAEFRRVADASAWLRTIAALTATNSWDFLGLGNGKNCYLYRSSSDGRWRLIPWDADASWDERRQPVERAFARKYPAIRRLLRHPEFRRDYWSFLAHIAIKEFAPEAIAEIVADCRRDSGTDGPHIVEFAAKSRAAILARLPSSPELAVTRVRRIGKDAGGDERLRLEGRAPISTRALRVDGRTVVPQFGTDMLSWTVDVAPTAQGTTTVEALDLDGDTIARATWRGSP